MNVYPDNQQMVAINIAELRTIVRETIEQILEEWFEDPDAGLVVREEVADRLRSTLSREQAGATDFVPTEEATRRLGVEW